ncbi:hypothetical protein HPP92_022229 [Vanilla planifolia]|uniref:Uncharacterized protein n=1 Tax=Vanilla planifolia TaxID=51239 RepID=A0A835UDM8_VANPL|nr:hypothetical protein HPP92_022545 [Vanilla planifolia]KAG0459101.1 hypothetical protein HPP92_022229 [Vanilla planifolia]
MALGALYIWTIAYGMMKKDSVTFEKLKREQLPKVIADVDNSSTGLVCQQKPNMDSGEEINDKVEELPPSTKSANVFQDQSILVPLLSNGDLSNGKPFWKGFKETVHQFAEELMEPPTIAAILGFVVGAIPWLKSLIVGESAPLRVIQDSLVMLGNGTLPCTTLILGGNLTRGMKKSSLKYSVILAIAVVRYVALPISGIAVVKAATALGLLPADPLYSYVLLTQFTLPPAVSIGVMAQLFGVGQEESSVIFLWTYLIAALALTVWSTVFMYIIS